MDVYGYIYLIRGRVNGKVYIGQTIYPIKERWTRHLKYAKGTGRKTKFVSALREYGAAGFDVVELGRAFSKDELNDMEIRAIWSHDAVNPEIGYNDALGGGGGGKWTEERRRRQSEKTKGRTFSPEALANMRASRERLRGRKYTEEQRVKQSEAQIKRVRTPAELALLAERTRRLNVERKGKPLSEEHRQKLLGRVPHNKGKKKKNQQLATSLALAEKE